MTQHHRQTKEVTFTELGEQPDDYIFEVSKADAHIREAELIGAVCVRFNIEQDRSLQVWSESVGVMKDVASTASETLDAEHQSVLSKLQLPSITKGLMDFENRSLHAATQRLSLDERSILGGIAVFDTNRGYKAGLFINWLVPKEFTRQAQQIAQEQTEYISTHHAVPVRLAGMATALGASSNRGLDSLTDRAAQLSIARGLLGYQPHTKEPATAARPLYLVERPVAIAIAA